MPRSDRYETVSDNSVQHIVQRGVNKRKVFMSDADYQYFRKLLLRYLRKYKEVKIYHYCIMQNHIHLLTFIENADRLSRFMQCLLLAYSFYYRSKHGYTGYLWQGRFKNFEIDEDSYLLECGRYIERNPLRTNKDMKDPSQYKWSSYNYYAKGAEDGVVTVNPLYSTLGKSPKQRREKYKEYVLTSRPYEDILDKVFQVK